MMTFLVDELQIDEQRLLLNLETAWQQTQQHGNDLLVSTVLAVPNSDPLDFFAAGAALADDRCFWALPSSGVAFAGVGATWSVALAGDSRFADAAAAWRERCADAQIDADSTVPATGPVAMSGFAFDPQRPTTATWRGFPAGRLVLPRYLLTRTPNGCWLTVNLVLQPHDDPCDLLNAARSDVANLLADDTAMPALCPAVLGVADALPAAIWQQVVGTAVAQIQQGAMEKTVLAREVVVHSELPFNIDQTLERLRGDYPDCFVFAVAHGSRCFVGASPERLVRLQGGEVAVTGLAGSIARGATAEEDERLGQELLASTKDRAEHAVVVRTIREALTDLTDDLQAPATPTLMQMRNVQHLFTPVTGQIAGDHTLLDLVERLHPTPAVGGFPREPALQFIRNHEQLDRGWYAGPIGWLDATGEGEFAVAIRSALIDAASGHLFAGCGIVADSDPAREYAESQWKLRPILNALGQKTP